MLKFITQTNQTAYIRAASIESFLTVRPGITRIKTSSGDVFDVLGSLEEVLAAVEDATA